MTEIASEVFLEMKSGSKSSLLGDSSRFYQKMTQPLIPLRQHWKLVKNVKEEVQEVEMQDNSKERGEDINRFRKH